MTEATATGSCLCGQVRYRIQGPYHMFQYCHCSRCRKFTGSAHAANIILPPEQFEWLAGEDKVGRYAVPEARHFATAFCRSCGSSLPWLGQRGKAVVVPAGTLDTAPAIKPVQNIFWGSRAEWYVPVAELPRHETLPHKTENS